MSTDPLQRILTIAETSVIANHHWKDRGVAPRGYTKGMAVAYARVVCKFKAGDAAALDMAKKQTGDPKHDALAHYETEFRALRMDNSVDGVDTLRHLWVLLLGLGMRESSGKYCEGRDTTASNTTADTAEAGLFQTSFNAHTASPLLDALFAHYANRTDFVDIFKEGVTCHASDLVDFGSGQGMDFQHLSKSCPAFAAEFAAVGLRHRRKHWGPINRKEAEIRADADAMFVQVQNEVDASNLCPFVL